MDKVDGIQRPECSREGPRAAKTKTFFLKKVRSHRNHPATPLGFATRVAQYSQLRDGEIPELNITQNLDAVNCRSNSDVSTGRRTFPR
jgi:hypothetical protein